MPEYKITEDDCAVYIPSGSTARFTPIHTCIGAVIAPENANGDGAYGGHFMYSKTKRSLVFLDRALNRLGNPENLILYAPIGGIITPEFYFNFVEGLSLGEREIAPDYLTMAKTHFKSIQRFMNIVRNSGIPEENMHIRWSPPGSLTNFSFNAGTNENEMSVSLSGENLYKGRIEDAPDLFIPEMEPLIETLKRV
ncbi:MAG: hypothetical protein JW754_02615 [Candidatus Aenigmarchaeota archaeon]|nr:hypothetical protein [Candidatus Aenigmarchaeota archaeon]